MILADFSIYIIYSFLTKKLGRNVSDAKFSSVLLLSAYISFFIIDSILLIDKIHTNKISQVFLRGGAMSNIIIMIPIDVIFSIRYYKCIRMEDIEKRIATIKPEYLKVMKTVLILFVIIIPMCYFRL